MKADLSLSQRFTRAFALLAIVVAGFFCLVSYIAVEVLETQVVDARLDKIADALIGQHLRQEQVSPPPEVSFYTNETIPEAMRALKSGLHELHLDQRPVEALIRFEGGNRYAVVQEMNDFEHTELIIFSALGVGFVASLILAVLLGRTTARHIVAPVKALADAVDASAEPSALPSLEDGDEIGTLARAFARRTEELQRYLLRERLFTGDVSHELRTPLTVMLGAAEVLKAQLHDRPLELAVAERIRRVAAEAAERVNALLWLSRAPEQLGAVRTALNPLIHAELERCRPLLEGKPVQCHFDETINVVVAAHAELVGIAVGNLLRNACQHTNQGTILIRLQPGTLTIEDTGSGIPERLRTHLFGRFVQGQPESGEGVGLGLSIVKRVVEHLGWQISLESPAGGRTGSRFIITFPVEHLDSDQQGTAAPAL